MDLSFLKWPIIIGVVVLIGWLGSSGGVNYMYNKFTASTPGQDAERDKVDETGLSRLGGYCLPILKYEKAMQIFETACQRYPQGEDYWFNRYRMVKCCEKLKNYGRAVRILKDLMANNVGEFDTRVPTNDVLNLRAEKHIELYELENR